VPYRCLSFRYFINNSNIIIYYAKNIRYWGNVMVVVKEIDSVVFGKILTILYGTMGFVFGIFTTIAALMGVSMPKKFGIFSLIFGKWAVLSLPIFYGVSGYFIGRIAASLYNIAVGSKKGLKVEVLR
jgi:hypothetical protein